MFHQSVPPTLLGVQNDLPHDENLPHELIAYFMHFAFFEIRGTSAG